jgi:hypothetical protein
MEMNDAGRDELEYYRRQVDELAGENFRHDMLITGLRYTLEQKRQGFAVLSELQQSVGAHQEVSSIFGITPGSAGTGAPRPSG